MRRAITNLPILFLAVSAAIAGSALAGAPSYAQSKPDSPQPKIPTQDNSVWLQTLEAAASQPLDGDTQANLAPRSNAQASASQQPSVKSAPEQDENPKRILGIIPNFGSKDDIPQNQAPLTTREKYALAYHQTVDISAHFGNAFQAMLQQASNGQPHYGQGWGAYAQRFGAAEGDQATSAFFIYGFLPHVLKQDPRYFRKRYGSVWSRMRYSASRTVIARSDSGQPVFNTPQVLGQLLQQGISTAYYPQEDRTASRVFQNWGINLAYTSAYNVLKEFYPDLLRIAFHRRPESRLASDPRP